MAEIISVLTYLGITPDKIFPLLVLGGAIIWFGYKFISPIKKSVIKINNALIEIQTIFNFHGIDLKHHLVEAPGSPLQPTVYGKQLIQESGLERILNDQASFLKEELVKKLPKNYAEYDIQENSRALLIELKDKEIMSPVKKYAYDNGLKLDVILRVGGLWLRDDFLGKPRQTKSDE